MYFSLKKMFAQFDLQADNIQIPSVRSTSYENVKNFSNTSYAVLCLTLSNNFLYWLLQTFNQDYDVACHTTYVVCINFYSCEAWPTV